MWSALRGAFPAALACCLMPDHLHLLVPADEEAWERLCKVLGRLGGWPYRRPPAPGLPLNREKTRRNVRYVLLNPCRAGLVSDPLEWVWSTHRDLIGAVREPWPDPGALAGLGIDHRYVSSDPSVAVVGTAAPSMEGFKPWEQPLGRVALAALAACRSPTSDLRRRTEARTVFLQLAWECGWRNATQLGGYCSIRRAAVHRAWKRERITHEARLCLADARLYGPGGQGYKSYP